MLQLTATDLNKTLRKSKGFFGFKFRDILRLRRKLMSSSCKYCRKAGAPIECFKCKEHFHLPCGFDNGCIPSMVRTHWRSYCRDCFVRSFPFALSLPTGASCFFCMEAFDRKELAYKPACCKADVLLHIACVRVSQIKLIFYTNQRGFGINIVCQVSK